VSFHRIISEEWFIFCLAFLGGPSDESSGARNAQKGIRTNMANEESNTATTAAEQGAHGASARGTSKKPATRKKGVPKGQKTAKRGKKTAKPASTNETAVPRADSKGEKILALIRRPKGATLTELAKLTGWQNHSIRGYLSGTVGKKMGLNVESARRADGGPSARPGFGCGGLFLSQRHLLLDKPQLGAPIR
jgi:hypothetical protein